MSSNAPERATRSRANTAPASAPVPVVGAEKAGFSIANIFRRPAAGAMAGTLIVFTFFLIFGGEKFLGAGGTSGWLNIASELLIVALPVGLLMIAGEFDLSVGSVVATSSITLAISSATFHLPQIIGVLLALGVGALVGFINGLMVARTNVPSFIVTLAMQFALIGLTLGGARLLTGSTSVPFTPEPFFKTIFGTLIDGIFEVAIIWALVLALVTAWILQMTKYGNWIFAVGGDTPSAVAAGIPVPRVKIALFMSTALGASLVGIIQSMMYNSAQTGTGQSFVFNSIIAVVVGGVLLTGGYGSVVGVVFGALTFAIVNTGIYFTGWESDWASLILGILLLAAVLMNNTFRRLALSGGAKAKTKKGA